MFIRGRDVQESKLALEFHDDPFTWELLGDADKFIRSDEQRAILDLISSNQGITPKEIAVKLKKAPSTTRTLLQKLVEADLVYNKREGRNSLYYTVTKENE